MKLSFSKDLVDSGWIKQIFFEMIVHIWLNEDNLQYYFKMDGSYVFKTNVFVSYSLSKQLTTEKNEAKKVSSAMSTSMVWHRLTQEKGLARELILPLINVQGN